MRKNLKKTFIFFFVIFGFLTIASGALALETNWPSSPGTRINLAATTTLPVMVKYFYEWGITIGGLAAFFALVMAGFQYLTSTGDPGKIKDATGKIQSALIGLVMLLASYLVLNLINPELTTLRTPTFEPATSTLDSINEEPPNITKTCEKAIIYSQSNYATGTELKTITKGDCQAVPLSKESGSIKIEGMCGVELYSISSCTKTPDGDEPMWTIRNNTPDIGPLYLPKNIQNIKVTEL